MEQKKNKRPIDGLSIGLLVAGIACLLISVPATYNTALMSTNHGTLGAVLRVFVMELLAFGAKLGIRWFPDWEKPLDWFAILMLTFTTLINFGDEWGALWRPDNSISGFWLGVRDFSVMGAPLGAILMVFIWSALAPAGVYTALTFWTKRQRQLELAETPDAVVSRRLQPIIVEMQVQQRLDEALLGLIEQRQRQYAALTGSQPAGLIAQSALPADSPVFQAPRIAGPAEFLPAYPAPRAVEGSQPIGKPSEPAPPAAEPAPAQEPSQPITEASEPPAQAPVEEATQAQEQPAETSQPITEASEPVLKTYETVGTRLDELLASVGMNREAAKDRLGRFGVKTPEAAFTALQRIGALPPAVSFEEFVPLFGVLMEQACDTCGKAMSQGERGVAVKYARRHSQPVRCTGCRR